MEFSGVQAIQTRIAAIQKRFGIEGPVPGAAPDFQQALTSELKKKGGTPEVAGQGTGTSGAAAANPVQTVHGGEQISLGGASHDTARFIRDAAAKYGLDSRLVSAVAEAESGGDQSEVSDAGAIGVMQLMPDTAAALGVNPYDEQQNIEGGAHYLKQMLDTFGGDMKKAIAAYNAGPQAVKDYNGVPPYAETQNYVNKVLDLYQ